MRPTPSTRPLISNAILLLCDMQEKFAKSVSHFGAIVNVSARMLDAARILDIPILATEQYPKGLGRTVPELKLKDFGVPIFEKTCFSMAVNPLLSELSRQPDRNAVLLCGIEAHACIYQTALDFLAKDYQVYLVVDAVSSRNQVDRMFALRDLEKRGCHLLTSECLLLLLLKDAGHPKFRDVQKLIMDVAPDSGLLHGAKL